MNVHDAWEFSALVLLAIQFYIVCRLILLSKTHELPALFVFSSFYLVYLTVRPFLLLLGLNVSFSYLNPYVDYHEPRALFITLLYSSSFIFVVNLYYKKKDVLCANGVLKNLYYPMFSIRLVFGLFLCSVLMALGLEYYKFAFLIILYCYSCMYFQNDQVFKKVFRWIIVFILLSSLYVFSDDRRDWLALLFLLIFFEFKILKYSLLKSFVGGLTALVVLMFISVAFRTEGISNPVAVFERLKPSAEVLFAALEVETDFSIVYDDLTLLNDSRFSNVDYLYGISFVKPLLSFIPREVWQEKPEASSRLFSYYFNKEYYDIGGSQPITFLGDLIWNFGVFAILFSYPTAFILSKLDLSVQLRGKYCIPSLVCILILFQVFRGPFDSFILFVLMIYIVHIFSQILLAKRFNLK